MTQDKSRAFKVDKAKYHAEWSDESMPITAQEDDAYKSGWGDGWQASRAALLDELQSEEMVEVVARAIYNKEPESHYDPEGEFYTVSYDEANGISQHKANVKAKAALIAIRQKLGEV